MLACKTGRPPMLFNSLRLFSVVLMMSIVCFVHENDNPFLDKLILLLFPL